MNIQEIQVVAGEELRDLWRRGWGAWVALGLSLLMSAVAVAMAATARSNLLDATQGMNVLVRVTLGGSLALMMFAAADSIAGERDRASLESMLLAPIDGRSLVLGKLVAAWSWWVVAFLLSVPYLLVLGRGLGLRTAGLVAALLTGIVLAALVGFWGSIFSLRSSSALLSVGASLLTVLVLAVPGQLPGRAMRGTVGTAVRAIDPISAGTEFLDRVLAGEALVSALPWLLSPVVWAVVSGALLYRMSDLVSLDPAS